jgi:hypothetical protein
VFNEIYKNRKWAIVTGCFLLPSALYYTSGIHKDLVIFTMLGLYFYAFYFSLIEKFTAKRTLIIFLSFIVMGLIRNYVAIALVPVSIALIICIKKSTRPFITFVSIYAMIFLILLVFQLIYPSFQPLKIITQKQTDFLNLPTAATQLNSNVLEPDLKSFIKNIPQAVDHGFLRPHLWDTNGNFISLFALELFFYELLFVLYFFKNLFKSISLNPFILFGIFFAISMLLITGLIIPNTGSIIRYKSIYLPLLIAPVLAKFSWLRPRN